MTPDDAPSEEADAGKGGTAAPPDPEVRSDTRVALCRCGQWKHMPFCDNTHRAIGFRSNPPTT